MRRVRSNLFAPGRRIRLAVTAIAGAAALAGCTLPPPAGTAPLRYRDPMFAVTEQDSLPYATAPDATGTVQTWTLDLYTPTGDTQTSRPAVVLVHGGGFRGGDSKESHLVRLANAFVSRGYVAVSINYPLLAGGHICSQENPPSPTCVAAALAAQHAAQAAVRWLRAGTGTYGVDAGRIAVEGTSAGAVTALAVAVNAGDPGTDGNPGYPSDVEAAMAISGELPHSYASTFNATDAPVQMFNGTADPVVPYAEGAQTASDLAAAGVAVVFDPLQGAGHVPFNGFGTFMVNQSLYFAYYFLHLDTAAGQPGSAAQALRHQESRLAHRYPGPAAWLRAHTH